MKNDDFDPLAHAELETLAIRAGHRRTEENEHGEPLFATSSYVFNSAAEAAALFSGEQEGNVYSRYTNPTVRIFEQRIAALEGAETAVATSSGMAAITSTFMALLKSGDHVVCSHAVFGTTTVLLNKFFTKFGVSATFIDPTHLNAWAQAFTANTKLAFLETPSNPLSEIADIEAIAKLAHKAGAKLVVDNCFCTPALQKPLSLGADIVVHSATKYLDGQGRCMGGVVLGDNDTMQEVLGFIRSAGPTMAPFNAWVFIKGLETLQLRMDAHSRNALGLANWLLEQELVETVNYSGLTTHPNHALAVKQQSGFGGVLSFEVKASDGKEGGKAAAWRFIDSIQLLSHTANLGDVKSTIVHPATTTHGRLSDEQRQQSGIKDNLIRVAVGLEALTDIQADLSRGLAAL